MDENHTPNRSTVPLTSQLHSSATSLYDNFVNTPSNFARMGNISGSNNPSLHLHSSSSMSDADTPPPQQHHHHLRVQDDANPHPLRQQQLLVSSSLPIGGGSHPHPHPHPQQQPAEASASPSSSTPKTGGSDIFSFGDIVPSPSSSSSTVQQLNFVTPSFGSMGHREHQQLNANSFVAQLANSNPVSDGHQSSSTTILSNAGMAHLATIGAQPPVNANSVIRLVEGFNAPVVEEQPGGKTNVKDALPRQVVELCVPVSAETAAAFVVKVHVLGYDKGTSSYKVVEDLIGESKFIEVGTGAQKRYVAIFTNLICKHSSHLNGQKLALRFVLCNILNQNQLGYTDSMDFKTLTKRGTQKRRQKRKKSDVEPLVSVVTVYPSMGPVTGGLLVKIIGNGFSCPPIANISVKFGERPAREVYCIKRNMIICETPEGELGEVDVKVSFDKQNYLPSEAKFTYVTFQNANLFTRQVFQPTPAEHFVQKQAPVPQASNVQHYSNSLPPPANWDLKKHDN